LAVGGGGFVLRLTIVARLPAPPNPAAPTT